jgi:hypothetical protein
MLKTLVPTAIDGALVDPLSRVSARAKPIDPVGQAIGRRAISRGLTGRPTETSRNIFPVAFAIAANGSNGDRISARKLKSA